MSNRIALPIAVGLTLLLAVILPILRMYLRTGILAVKHPRQMNGPARAVYVSMLLLVVVLTAWLAVYTAAGPEAAGVWHELTLATAAGWALALGGLALLLVAQANMGRSWRIGIDSSPTALVTSGLYRLVRNPIYTGMGAMVLALPLIAPCPVTLAACLAGVTLLAVQARIEEQHLLAMHGDTYREYAARVGRFIPAVGRLRSAPGAGA
jgi:protein-S-isoprenylcysteine O-methyltransferase Ste14